MKNYRVKALISFDDNEEQEHRNIGDIFMVTKERYNVLNGNNPRNMVAVDLIGIDVDNVDKPVDNYINEVKPKRGRKKKEQE